ncbi:MAG: DEAD/DEAH box helicase [Vampirovibrionales bacterium]
MPPSTSTLTVGQYELKHYQQAALTHLEHWITDIKANSFNYSDAWYAYQFKHKTTQQQRPWQERRNGLGQQLPHGCIMLPTGGGKTLVGALAVNTLQHQLRQRGQGLVLWVVPSEAIYKQTLKQFRNVSSPLHQLFKACAGGATPKIIERHDSFRPSDVQETLCVMVLTLQSFNVGAKSKEARKLYQACSSYAGFFPKGDEAEHHKTMKATIPNLDCFSQNDFDHYMPLLDEYPMVKASLANVFRIVQPLVVVDECHRAKNKKALENINQFNPSAILELSATPFENSNIIYQAHGKELWQEQMIKLPIHVKGWEGISWQECLKKGYEKRRELEELAHTVQGNYGIYVRPILLIRVQRTGKDQLEAGYIHSNDVEQWLREQGVPSDHIAKRSSEEDDLGGVDLMADTCSIRYIITKDALREGWDCPFAYVLCNLDNTKTDVSMTQMLGRILRQPYAQCIEPALALNEAYVYCYNMEVKQLSDTICEGLEKQGLGSLKGAIIANQPDTAPRSTHTLKRRPRFASEEIVLPTVLFHPRKAYRISALPEAIPLNWKEHLLPEIRFDALKIDLPAFQQKLDSAYEQSTQIGFYKTSKKGEAELGFLQQQLGLESLEPEKPTPTALYKQLYPVIPNAFVAHELLGEHLEEIQACRRPFDLMSFIRQALQQQVFEQSEAQFKAWLHEGVISFELVEGDNKAFRLPSTLEYRSSNADPKLFECDNSLFDPLFNELFNNAEGDVAGYLDSHQAVVWWHRLFAKQAKEYKLQGWQPQAVYPDFLIKRLKDETTGMFDYVLLETKGEHLLGNSDTVYKQTLLDTLAKHYKVVGSLQRQQQGFASLVLALQDGYKIHLDKML